MSLKEYKQDLGLIAEAGLVAIKQGDERGAKALFQAVGVLDPDSTHQEMGYGLIAMHKLEIASALDHFATVLKQEPENHRAQAFKAFAHMLAVMNPDVKSQLSEVEHLRQSALLAENVLKHTQETSTKELAQSIVTWQTELHRVNH